MASTDLRVYLDGVPIGTASQVDGNQTFTYDDDYRDGPDPTPLSLSMPLSQATHKNRAVKAYLEGLLPDSEEARQRLAREFTASPNNAFSLLRHVGRDAAGAVQILPVDVEPSDAAIRTGDITWLSESDFDDMLRELAVHKHDWDPGRDGGRWSLAGAQPKMALHRDTDESGTARWGIPNDSTPTTHIVKPSIEAVDNHHVNETLCLLTARNVGIPAARTEIIERGTLRAVVSHRYDRARDPETGRWRRIHQEDMCQALSVQPAQKYQSDGGPGVGEIADLFASRLSATDRDASANRFFRALVFNVLIGGTDAHAKNFSMLLIGGRAQLAPLYDVASMAPYPAYRRLISPMRIGEHDAFLDVTDKDWARVARRLGIDPDQGVSTVEELRSQVPEGLAHAVTQLPLSVRPDATHMADKIADHVDRSWRPDLERDPATVLGLPPD